MKSILEGESMALKFGPAGTLYFMKERDRFDQSTFPFVKIGIVKGDADVKRRESEHQTGNPREIYSHKDIASPAVQMLETFMHNYFAAQRIKGEWFRDELLDLMVTEAEKRAAELKSAQSFHSELSDLEEVASKTKFKPCNEAATEADVARRWILESSFKNHKKQCKAISDRMADLWSEEYADFFKKTTRQPKTEFQATLAKKLYPDLSKQFVEETKVWKRVWLSTSSHEQEAADDSPDLSDLLSSSSLEELHGAYLEEWSKSVEVEWELANLQARLFAELGTNEVLTHDGQAVLKWELKSSSTFNKAAFVESNPEEASKCMKSDPGGDSYSAAEWKCYG